MNGSKPSTPWYFCDKEIIEKYQVAPNTYDVEDNGSDNIHYKLRDTGLIGYLIDKKYCVLANVLYYEIRLEKFENRLKKYKLDHDDLIAQHQVGKSILTYLSSVNKLKAAKAEFLKNYYITPDIQRDLNQYYRLLNEE